MAFKMKINGIDVEVDSVLEAAALIDLATGKKISRETTYLPSVKEKKSHVSWLKEEIKYIMDHIDKDPSWIHRYLTRHTRVAVQSMKNRIWTNNVHNGSRKMINELIIEFPYLGKVIGKGVKK